MAAGVSGLPYTAIEVPLHRFDSRPLALVVAIAGTACGDRNPSSPTGTDSDTDPPGSSSIQIFPSRDVDVLFVIDNSESMGPAQGRLAAAIPAFLDVLEDPDYPINYRIAVTTTDNGNPACEGTSPESGALQVSSCRSRIGEFVIDGDIPADATAIGCTDVCDVESIETELTTTTLDASPRPRPWVESIEGRTNLPPGVTPATALPCVVPQGIAGCGFESPLESMYRAIERAADPADPQHGFLRGSATFAVVVMTDEVDCSYNPEFESVFLAEIDGGTSPVFWSDPEADAPTSAVCWNAGIICEGDGMPYDSCRTSNKNSAGFEDIPPGDAVLHPVERYIDALEGVRQNKILPRSLVAGFIDGVPPADGELVYAVSPDDADQLEYGIGPGCTFDDDGDPGTPATSARPPVREVEVAEWFAGNGTTHLHSICQPDFSAALTAIGESIRDDHGPTCMTACVADTDPDTAGLQPQCVLTEEVPIPEGGGEERDVPPCLGGGVLPEGETRCYELRTDAALAPSCAEYGWNLEIRIVRANGVPAIEGAAIGVACEYSGNRAVDCPNLP